MKGFITLLLFLSTLVCKAQNPVTDGQYTAGQITKATEKIQFGRFSQASEGVDSWVRYNDVDFSSVTDGYVVVCAKANENTVLCLQEQTKAAKRPGRIIAKLQLTVKTENGHFRRDMSGQWITLAAPLEYTPKGVSDLVITCQGEGVEIDWVQFKNRQKYFSPISSASQSSQPDERGFIHRWLLLEPIRQDVKSNVVFTNTYLQDIFTRTWFKNQMTSLPKEGQREKVGNQRLTWHALDSETYNVRLFRFAEKWGQQTYGSLFWGVTIIDCPEEIANVRLAAGSNGASMWWLNGEKVLLLEGDRRMVEDDGMSHRLTLKKGPNILRCAIINGPGLSDLCVRFLDEKGLPITNYSITTKLK